MLNFEDTVSSEILDIAKELLDGEDFAFIDSIVEMIRGKEREAGINIIRQLIGTKPKRPVYYLNMSLRFLPEGTRDVIRYAGDYIDQLMKQYVFEHTRLFAGLRAHSSSLKSNIKKARKFAPAELLNYLRIFDECAYVPAKHHWDTKGKDHLFSLEEALVVCLIMQKLADKIIAVSPTAAMYSRNELFSYY